MKPPAEWLRELTEASVVRIHSGRGGTGFFVAPGAIVTCAHVVTTGRAVTAGPATVVYQKDIKLTGLVEAWPPDWGSGRLWAYPDLCLIRLTSPPDDHPVVFLGETSGDNDIYLTGFQNVYEDNEPGTRGGTFSGSQRLKDGTARRIAGCEVPGGLSGSPVTDLTEGVVCGVVKATGGRGMSEGVAIPAQAIREKFSDIWDWNQQYGDPDGQWRALRDALRDGVSKRYEWLTDSEWRALVDGARNSDVKSRRLMQVWRDIVGPLLAQPDKPFDKIADVVRELADLDWPGNGYRDHLGKGSPPAGLDPLVKLFEVCADRFGDSSQASLTRHADNLAARNGQTAALAAYRNRNVRRDRPVIVIRLEPSVEKEKEKEEVNLTAWAYDDWDAPQRQVTGEFEYGPHPVEEIKETILKMLDKQLGGLPTMIQFVLPDHMLDEAVERWYLDGLPVGIRHPVVVRFAEWPGENGARRAWDRMQSWRDRFESLTMPVADNSWAPHWVDCANPRTRLGLAGMFYGDERPPFIAMAAWRDGDPVPMPVDTARQAGVPVIIWRHKECQAGDLSACHGAGGTCAGSLFRRKVIEDLSGVTFGKLPEEIKRVRAAAAEGDDPELGLGMAILWDEPGRVPWEVIFPSQAPVSASASAWTPPRFPDC